MEPMPTPAPTGEAAMEPMPTPAPTGEAAMEPMPTPAPTGEAVMEPMPTPAPRGDAAPIPTPQVGEATDTLPTRGQESRDFVGRVSEKVIDWVQPARDLAVRATAWVGRTFRQLSE